MTSGGDLTNNHEAGLHKTHAVAGLAGNAHIDTTEARTLMFADEPIGGIVSLPCLHSIEDATDRQTVCREIAPVLKPEGVADSALDPATHRLAGADRAKGLLVTGLINAVPVALGRMFRVKARIPRS